MRGEEEEGLFSTVWGPLSLSPLPSIIVDQPAIAAGAERERRKLPQDTREEDKEAKAHKKGSLFLPALYPHTLTSVPPLAFSSACNGKKRRRRRWRDPSASPPPQPRSTSSNRGRGRSNEERKLLEREAGVRLTDWGSLSSRFRRGQGLRASARQRNQYGSGGKSAVRKSLEEEGS